MGGAAHEYSKDIAKQVEVLTAVGIPQDNIGYIVGLTSKTIRKYYRAELDNGKSKVDGAVGGQLVKKALNGDTASIIFYLKTRCGWREVQETETTIKMPDRLVDAPPPTNREEWLEYYKNELVQ